MVVLFSKGGDSMDKDLEKKIRELGAIERAYDSEDWRKSEDLAKAVIMNENYEDSLESIRSLKKKLKANRGILITGIIVFLILLLYMFYTAFNKPVPVQPAVTEPEPQVITQHIVNKNLVFALDVPSVSIDSYSIGDLLENKKSVNLSDGCLYENYGTDDWECVLGKSHQHDLDTGVVVYKVSDLEKAIASTPKVYSFVDSLPTASGSTKEMLVGSITGDDETIKVYNKDIASKSNVQENDLVAKVDTTDFSFTFYEKVDENEIKEVISKVFNEGGYNVNFSDETTVKDALAEIFNQLKELNVKMSYSYGDLAYDYYDSAKTEGDVKIFTKSGVDEVPEYIYNYTVTDAEVIYNTLACAYYYGWE